MYRELVAEYGFALDPRNVFEANAPVTLVTRAAEFVGNWVLWDPNDDEDGFFVVGDDLDILFNEFWAHVED